MSKRRFFVSPQQVKDSSIVISGPDVNHIRNVLRLGIGDSLIVSDSCDFEYEAKIVEISPSEVKAATTMKKEIEPVFPQVTLVQAISKGEKMDTIVRQATELGVSAIVPIITSRTVVRLDEEKKKNKLARWQKVAKEASSQSQRSTVLNVYMVLAWDELLNVVSSFDLVIMFWEEAKESFSGEALRMVKRCHKEASYAVIIGPEGGFSQDEIGSLEKREASCFSLGRQILRAETASVVSLAIVLYELEKLSDSLA